MPDENKQRIQHQYRQSYTIYHLNPKRGNEVDDFGPIGKIIAGVTRSAASTLLEYDASGF
jgi:hypothetical protein